MSENIVLTKLEITPIFFFSLEDAVENPVALSDIIFWPKNKKQNLQVKVKWPDFYKNSIDKCVHVSLFQNNSILWHYLQKK